MYIDTSMQPSFHVMSYNVRVDTPDDGENAWPNRKGKVASAIRFYQVALLGLQEPKRHQIDELLALLPEYEWFGASQDNDAERGGFTPILYRSDRFDLREQSTFWLSATPDAPGSIGWDAAFPRVVTWGHFIDKATGSSLYAFNTHFDHFGEQARINSAHLLLARVQSIAGSAPVIVTGDLNCKDTSPSYRILVEGSSQADGFRLKDGRNHTLQPAHGTPGTLVGFEVGRFRPARIDYIFAQNDVTVLRHGVIAEHWHGLHASDHLPVMAAVLLPTVKVALAQPLPKTERH